MIHLKSIHSSLTPAQQASFIRTSCFRRKKTFVSFSKYSRNSSSDGKGDIRQQELLATIALLQTQKLRLTEYLDERSAYLTQFAEEANTEMDQIGENALKELDEAGARVSKLIRTCYFLRKLPLFQLFSTKEVTSTMS